ncbi:MAG: hypothetical protein ACFFDT_31430 [Candidatus Hodarchaeota archaeon]
MNKQLEKTLDKVSPKIMQFIEFVQKVYEGKAKVSIGRIDRPLLLTSGTVQQVINRNGNIPKSTYWSIYYTLSNNGYDDFLSQIPPEFKLNDQSSKGLELFDFLIKLKPETVKAVIHIDVLRTDGRLEWFKVMVNLPKENKSLRDLLNDEDERRARLEALKVLRGSK